ncbi:hypothetical protein EDD18DRAFT_1363245 [Armillaria luteobubalina]|uniref:Uncharacterized protein n=1 Tax=Armillaria luteobubalina TaxID=153913 RepID=A0AA39PBF1_9AGAR|nr:hypothetical protein EDD18DRAFT_1363245 [Armillaria luteobubalina]
MHHSQNRLSAESLRRDPKFLTKLSRPDNPIHAWDGLCGAVVNEHMFITSPNCPLLFDPPLGVNREMWMRNDYRYGEDDPLSWPQPYCASRPYLSCLRLCERTQSDPDLPLFQLPIRADFLELDTSSLIRGPGLWAADCRSAFEHRCRVILGRSMNFARGDDASTAGANQLEQLKVYAGMFLERLKALPMTFPRLCLCVAETQRLVLEVEAISTFFSTIRPRFAACVTTPTPKADMDLVGCFTTDIGVAQQLHRAGVPVWLLRPLDDVAHTRIDKVVEMSTASGRVHLGTCPLRLPSVYVGSGGDEAKYNAFDHFTRSHLGPPRVFVWTSGQLRSEPSRTRGKQNISAQGVFSPYNQANRSRKGHLKPGPANQFEMITHALLPEIRPPWRDALLGVNVDKGRVNVPAAPFAFPRPDLFVTISDSAKRMSVLSTWLRLRPGLLAMQTSSYCTGKFSHQMWRAILSYDWVGKSDVHDRVRGKETHRRDLVATILVGCLDEMSIQEGVSVDATWRGKSMPHLDVPDVHEILWELSELGFRLEFLSVDSHLRIIENDSALRKHKRHLGHCFPQGRYDRCWIVELGEAHRGLAESSWMRRAPYVCSLRRVMSTWRNSPQSVRDEKGRYTEEMLTSLQRDMALFYSESFYLAFGQAPTLPRVLCHVPDMDAEYPERAVSLTKSAGYYHDVTEWEASY